MPGQPFQLARFSMRNAGFTLVELIVAAGILALAIMGVVAVTRKTHEAEVTFRHHRRARALIDSCLEHPSLSYINYDNLQSTSAGVLIDTRDADNPEDNLTGTLTVTVTDTTIAGSGGGSLACKQINAAVTWTEPHGDQETVSISKCVTDIP